MFLPVFMFLIRSASTGTWSVIVLTDKALTKSCMSSFRLLTALLGKGSQKSLPSNALLGKPRPAGRPAGRPVVAHGRRRRAWRQRHRSFDRGSPVWPPRSNVTNDRLGEGPSQKPGLWGAAPPSQNRFVLEFVRQNSKNFSPTHLAYPTHLLL